MEARYTLVLLRHGESHYTQKNLFCGFGNDADLSDIGVREAALAGQRILKAGLEFDLAFTSVLKRAVKTLFLVQETLDCHWLPVVRTWRLNERHYGDLQGLSKTETAKKYGEAQVKTWRRSYDVRPPVLDKKDPRFCSSMAPYRDLDPSIIPVCESLKDTMERMLPFWHDEIAPKIKTGKRVLIIAHGNSLRGLMKYLKRLSDEEITKLEIPQAIPLVLELSENLQPIRDYYLASEEEVKTAKAKVGVKDNVK
ncbi:2,3-bisphosphoglycerate-dependent phosphoglycerate mutase [Plakobranchus ocellatus]|uniref:phosphoglycerate mutase (2,3-diphosphoglycerate-dependent) n=1 Tax=Plakobranchus ocellatus TaxID=259542 RepID=A0AAV4CY71_9GAST|nr:2,3-bisphosphoglycerate-dependent phosphoglycerate mutase [Plakobranchus ocellatus]